MAGEKKTLAKVRELTAPGRLSNLDLRSTVRVLTPVATAFLLSGCTEQQDEYLRKEGYTYYHALPLIKNSQVDSKNPLDNAKTISAIYAERDGDPFLIYERKVNGSTERESYPIHLLYVGTPDAIETVVIIAPNDPKTEDETWKSDPNKFQELLTLELRKPVSKETLDNWQTDPDSVDIKTMTFWDPLNGKGITVGEESDEGPKEVAMLLVAPPVARPNEQVTVTPTLMIPTVKPETKIPIPLPPAELKASNVLTGVDTVFASRLDQEGFGKSLIGQEGSWQAKTVIVGWNQDGTPIIENDVQIVSLNIEDVNNPGYANGIVKGVDNQGKTIFWSEEEKTWIVTLKTEGADIDNPTYYPKGKEYLAIESILLNPNLNKPFSEEAKNNYKGWLVVFERNDGKDLNSILDNTTHAFLTPDSPDSIRWVVDQNGNPVFFTDGTNESIPTQLLLGQETIFSMGTAGEWWINTETDTLRNYFKKLYPNFHNELSPQLEIGQMGGWFANHNWGSFPFRPSLDNLLTNSNKLGEIDKSVVELRINQVQTGLLPNGTFVKISDFPLFKDIIKLQNFIWPISFTTNQ